MDSLDQNANATSRNFDSEEVAELVEHNESQLIQAVNTATATRIAEAVGRDKSTISRMATNGDWHRVAIALAMGGKKIVPENYVTVDPEELAALRVLACKRLERQTKEQRKEKTLISWEDME